MSELPEGILAILGSDMADVGETFRAEATEKWWDFPPYKFLHAKQLECHLQLDYLAGDAIAYSKAVVFDKIGDNWILRCDTVTGVIHDDRLLNPEDSNKEQLLEACRE